MKPTQQKCSNCGKPIEKYGVMFPTTDEKRRNQCVECARKWMEEKENQPPTSEWEQKLKEMIPLQGCGVSTNQIIEVVKKAISQAKSEAVGEYKRELVKKIELLEKLDTYKNVPERENEDAGIFNSALQEIIKLLK